MSTDIDRPVVDGTQNVHLENGWVAAVAVTPSGEEEFWLLNPGGVDDPDRRFYFPRHEELGPLPRSIADAIGKPRCGATKADGNKCRAFVASSGMHCHHHDATDRLF